MVDKRYDMTVAAEFMLRHFFSQQAKDKGIKKAQDQQTRQILKFIGGDEEEAAFVRSEVQFHSDRGVSPIWLSPEFTLPLFGLAAEDLCDQLSPQGKGNIRCLVEADETAFFGLRFVGMEADESSEEDNYAFDLFALAGTKRYLENEAGMRSVHDLVAKRLASMKSGNW